MLSGEHSPTWKVASASHIDIHSNAICYAVPPELVRLSVLLSVQRPPKLFHCTMALCWKLFCLQMLSGTQLLYIIIIIFMRLIFIPMQFAMQNSDWRRILLSDSTPPKANIRSTLLCTIYCLNYFAKMLSGPQSYMESNSASNWYSFQMQFAMQNSEWRRILLSDSTPPKADLFHSTMHNLLSKLLC